MLINNVTHQRETLSERPVRLPLRCSMTTMAQDKPYNEIPLETAATARGALPYTVTPGPIQTILNHHRRDQLLVFRTSFHEKISSEFLVEKNVKHTQFSLKHLDGTRTRNLSHAKRVPYRLR